MKSAPKLDQPTNRVITEELIYDLALSCGIKFEPRWGTCSTGNAQIKEFALKVFDETLEIAASVCDAEERKKWEEIFSRGNSSIGEIGPKSCAKAIRQLKQAF